MAAPENEIWLGQLQRVTATNLDHPAVNFLRNVRWGPKQANDDNAMEILTQFRSRRSVNSPRLFGANVEGLSVCIAIIPTYF